MKPGFRTTEFWLSLVAVVVGALIASGVIKEGTTWSQAIAVVASVLGALGYSASRAFAKSTEIKAAAIMGAAAVRADPTDTPPPA